MNKKHILFSALVLVGLSWFGCEPTELDKPNIGSAPTAEELDFTITQGSDPYHFVIVNTSSVKGVASWDLGNGMKDKGDSVIAYYPLPDTYNIELTLYTKAGSAKKIKSHETTETDWSYFTDSLIIALCGGAEDPDGKTWVIDSLTRGHFGVGPSSNYNLEWWNANPLEKSADKIYDDEWTFILQDFRLNINSHGQTLCSNTAVDRGLTGGYYVERIWNNDFDSWVTTNDANRGNMVWMVEKNEGKYYIKTSPDGAILGFDRGGPNVYEVIFFDEHYLYLRVLDNESTASYNRFIAKGYAPPTITFDFTITPTGSPNEYNFSISNLSVPQGATISQFKYNFGDGETCETANPDTIIKHTYMRKGTYIVKLETITSLGTINKEEILTIDSNHPSYTPYLLDAMVMYNDFGETTLVPMQVDQAGGEATLEIVSNPDNSLYPNRSAHCALFTKYNTQWANAYTRLPDGYRFDLTLQPIFKVLVYGTAGDQILLKLENTDRGANAWQTGTYDVIYTIQNDNKWEIAEFNFAGVGAGWDWTGDIYTSDVTTDPNFNTDFYNIVRIMINPGNSSGTFSVHLDDLAGPHVEGLK